MYIKHATWTKISEAMKSILQVHSHRAENILHNSQIKSPCYSRRDASHHHSAHQITGWNTLLPPFLTAPCQHWHHWKPMMACCLHDSTHEALPQEIAASPMPQWTAGTLTPQQIAATLTLTTMMLTSTTPNQHTAVSAMITTTPHTSTTPNPTGLMLPLLQQSITSLLPSSPPRLPQPAP